MMKRIFLAQSTGDVKQHSDEKYVAMRQAISRDATLCFLDDFSHTNQFARPTET